MHFTGRVSTEQLVKLYNQAMIVLSPSLYEGFGLPAAEAMSCGSPVIATTGGAFPAVIDRDRTGWLVEPGSARALADAICKLSDDEDLRERLGTAGRESILERFNWRKAAEETLVVYEELLAARRSEAGRKRSHQAIS